MTGEIIKRYADIAREHLSRDYGLVYLDCNHMLAIEATVTTMQRERDEAREMLRLGIRAMSVADRKTWADGVRHFLSRCEGAKA